MLVNDVTLATIHQYCTGNRPLLEVSKSAGCLFCLSSFEAAEITEWIEPRDGASNATADTAICPRCGKPSVLPSSAPIAMTDELLHAVRAYWFSGVKR